MYTVHNSTRWYLLITKRFAGFFFWLKIIGIFKDHPLLWNQWLYINVLDFISLTYRLHPKFQKIRKFFFLKSVIIKFLKLLNPQHHLLKGRWLNDYEVVQNLKSWIDFDWNSVLGWSYFFVPERSRRSLVLDSY